MGLGDSQAKVYVQFPEHNSKNWVDCQGEYLLWKTWTEKDWN